MQTNATVAIESVTPKQAAAYLDNIYGNQRPLRESWVQRLIGEMKTGSFRLSCDALVFVGNTLFNGQHRLQAVARSGVTCQFLVLRSEDPHIYQIIDSGAKRTVSDVITGDNRTLVASISAWAIRYDAGMLSAGCKHVGNTWKTALLRSNQLEFIDKHRQSLAETAALAKTLYMQNRFLPPSISGAIVFIANRERNSDAGLRFIEAVYTGTQDGAARVVRDKLINNSLSRSKLPTTYVMAVLIKAFKSWEKGTTPASLSMNAGEAFPSFDLEPKKK